MTQSNRSASGFMIVIGIAASWFFLASAARAIEEAEAPQYTTSYKHADRVADGFAVDDFTSAPLQIAVMTQLDTTSQQAFQLVSIELDKGMVKMPNVAPVFQQVPPYHGAHSELIHEQLVDEKGHGQIDRDLRQVVRRTQLLVEPISTNLRSPAIQRDDFKK